MINASQIIAEFRNESTDRLPNPDTSIKVHLIRELETIVDTSVIDFLIEVAGDPNEFDLARIEAFRVLELRHPATSDEAKRVASVIAKVLRTDKDDQVRNYAAMAGASYITHEIVADAIVRILLDDSADEDLRWNAFAAVERGGPTPQGVAAMNAIRHVAQFQQSAERILREWMLTRNG